MKSACSWSQTGWGSVRGERTRSWVSFSMSFILRSSMRLIGGGAIFLIVACLLIAELDRWKSEIKYGGMG